MFEQTISRDAARRVYNALGSRLDRAARYEANAKRLALELLAPQPGQRVLQVSVGTGVEQAALRAAVGPQGSVVGYDLSRGMLELTRQRADTPLCEGDAVRLPFASGSFDRLFSAYMLDLIPSADLAAVLAEFRRVLCPGGRLALVSLTEGVDLPSHLFIARWKLLYRLAPERMGGCRPIELGGPLAQAGFRVERQVVVQRGCPSEVLVGEVDKGTRGQGDTIFAVAFKS